MESITNFIGGGYKEMLGKGQVELKTKNQTFEEFLSDRFAEDYHGLDDDMPDAFDRWLANLDIDEIISYGDDFGKQEYELGQEEK